jgi:DNA replication protein DnaC
LGRYEAQLVEWLKADAIASHAVRRGKRDRFYSVVDLVNQLEQEQRTSDAGRLKSFF